MRSRIWLAAVAVACATPSLSYGMKAVSCSDDVSGIKVPQSTSSVGALNDLKYHFQKDQEDRVAVAGIIANNPGAVEQGKKGLDGDYNPDKIAGGIVDDLRGAGKITSLEQLADNDNRRLNIVLDLLKAGRVRTGEELYYAGFILQHSMCNSHIKLANTLAAAAIDRGDENAKWLYAASMDRYLVGEGKPQKYGTQFAMRDGKPVQYPVDPGVTDAERAKYNVLPLSEIIKRGGRSGVKNFSN